MEGTDLEIDNWKLVSNTKKRVAMNASYKPGKTTTKSNLFYNLYKDFKKLFVIQTVHCLTSQERRELSMTALASTLCTMEKRRTKSNAGIKLMLYICR